MSLKCKQGIEYNCPYRRVCESNEPMNISSINPQRAHLIYLRAKSWSDTTLTWADGESLYACHPENLIRKRHIEIMHGKTFCEEDATQIREKVLEEIISRLKKLKDKR